MTIPHSDPDVSLNHQSPPAFDSDGPGLQPDDGGRSGWGADDDSLGGSGRGGTGTAEEGGAGRECAGDRAETMEERVARLESQYVGK